MGYRRYYYGSKNQNGPVLAFFFVPLLFAAAFMALQISAVVACNTYNSHSRSCAYSRSK